MMFDYADVDGDGKLSFGEFLNIMNPPKNTDTEALGGDEHEAVEDNKTVTFDDAEETS